MQNHAGAQKHVQEDKKNSRTMLQGFMQNHAGAKKHVQEDKKNRGWTVLDGGVFSVSPKEQGKLSLAPNLLLN